MRDCYGELTLDVAMVSQQQGGHYGVSGRIFDLFRLSYFCHFRSWDNRPQESYQRQKIAV